MPEDLPMESQTDGQTERFERGRRVFRKAFLFFLVLALIGGAYWVGFDHGRGSLAPSPDATAPLSPNDAIFINKNAQDATIDFSLFWKVWGLLKDKYVDRVKLDARTLFYGAIKGMLAATGDPYTTFFDPEENKQFNEEITGTFDGIGAEMGIKNDVLTIIAPLDGTPAAKAGLMAGDKVLKVDGVSTANLSLDDAVNKIRGPKGTAVTLNILRAGEDQPRDVVVKRDTILVQSVKFEMKENGLALIRISRFGDDTVKGFQDAAKQVRAHNATGLIIDLRNNPGGYLEAAVDIGSQMLPQDAVVVQEENAAGDRKQMKARGGDILSRIPTVVLINEGSASASEILAGALKDDRSNVTLVGKKSFGKGSVQELISTSSDTSVKITVARWLTPDGTQINTVGIAPDTEVGLTADDITQNRDPQMDKALELLKPKP